MKRNYVIKISLTIFSLLLVLLVGIDRVNAKSVTIIGNGGSLAGANYGKLTMSGSTLKGTLKEIGNTSHIAMWKINGQTAFCIDPFVASTKGAEYKITTRDATSFFSNKDIFKAFNFAAKNSGTLYAVGQAVAWGLITGKIDKLRSSADMSSSRYASYKEFRIIYEVISDRYDSSELSDPTLTKLTIIYLDNLYRESDTFIGWKIWEGVCGGGQKYISKATPRLASEDIVCSGGCTGDNCETEPTPKCDAKGTISTAGECGVTSDYADPATLNDANWECMITEKKEYYEDKYATPLGSKYNYCTFYCNEHVTTTYPGDDGYVFNAGSYFTVGMSSSGNLWGPIYVYGVRECRSYYNNGVKLTQGVNWKRFYSDLIKKELQLKREYNIWKQTLSRQIAGEQSSSSGYRSSKCYVCDTPYSDPSITDNSYCDGYWQWETCIGTWVESYKTEKTCDCDSPVGNSWDGNRCCSRSEGMYYPRVTGPNLPTAEGGTINGFASEKCITPDTSYADTSWKNTQAIINEMILAMQQCDAADTRYQLNPTIVFNYDANKDGQYLYKYGDSASEMKLQASAEANDDSSGDVITDGGEETVPYTQCQDSKDGVCKDVPARFLHTSLGGENPKLYSTYTEKNISYSLPDGGGYKYVSKNDGSAFKILSGDIESKGLYTSYDDSILPLDYKLSSGTYYIGFTYSDIGNSAHKQTPHFTYMLQNNQIADFTDTGPYEYVCKFRIKNDILKDCAYECNKYDTACIDAACGTPPRCTNGSTAANCPSGITVIYRTIQLQKDSSGISKTDLAASFPSYNANGRSPGVNWSTSDVASYITNNRGVYGNEVYSKTPMYEITLTPSTIIQIRNYNKQENDNNRGGYADFNYSMSCVKGTGRNCISSFIHSKFSILFSGTCMNATQSDFLSCQKAG